LSFEDKVKIGKCGRKSIDKVDLEKALQLDPDTTHSKLGKLFGCNGKIISRELKRHGLRTKKWCERKHSEETKKKISQTRIESGIAEGKNNPNYGDKDRPWLVGDENPLRQWHKENPDFGDNQKGKNNPIHQVKHLYDDPEYVKRITRGIRAHVDEKRGSTYEEVYGEKQAKEYKQKLREASPARISKIKQSETKPEKLVKELLESLDVVYESQAVVGYYTVDFLLPNQDVVVQADGDFWHANPEFYGDDELYALQKKNRRIDASCNSFLEDRDYTVVRFWENDLYNHLDECRSELVQHLGDVGE
jgi:very-short-patch-repair endonuclease